MLGSGVLNVRRLLQQGIKVGLGTDVAGGYSTSVLDAARQAIIASRCISFNEQDEEGKPYEALTIDVRSLLLCVCVCLCVSVCVCTYPLMTEYYSYHFTPSHTFSSPSHISLSLTHTHFPPQKTGGLLPRHARRRRRPGPRRRRGQLRAGQVPRRCGD